MIRGPKTELESNEHVGKVFFLVKSFTTFYFIQYHKNAFRNELFLSAYSILQMELCFPDLIKNYSQISVQKKNRVYVAKTSTRKINFQLTKFTFYNDRFLISNRKAAIQLL